MQVSAEKANEIKSRYSVFPVMWMTPHYYSVDVPGWYVHRDSQPVSPEYIAYGLAIRAYDSDDYVFSKDQAILYGVLDLFEADYKHLCN